MSVMLIPLLLMALSFNVYYFIALIQRMRVELLQRERNCSGLKQWYWRINNERTRIFCQWAVTLYMSGLLMVLL